MSKYDVCRLSATKIVELIKNRELSPVELIQTTLEQIERYKVINAVCTISPTVLEDAKKAEEALTKGEVGLLHGLPVGIKDVTPVAGMPTTYGCPLYKDYIPPQDALVVQRLKAAGAIIIGKTNTPEFATGGNTFNDVFGCTRNPWNPNFSAGGSTGGGAAALATGMIALAEGTDLGGSLRIPASFCGIVGLRPSPGLIPTYPSAYLWDNMQVTGPMARTAEDIALVLQAVSGPSPLSPVCQPTTNRDFVSTVAKGVKKDLKIAYCHDIADIGIDSEIKKICHDGVLKLKEIGANIEEIDLDLSFARKPFLAIRGLWMVCQQNQRLDKRKDFGPNLAGNIEAGLKTVTEDLGKAEHIRGKMWHMFYELFNKYDFVLTPCMAVPPFSVEQNYPETIAGKEMKTYIDWVAPTFLLSLTGLPVGCVPCGLTETKLPVGMQIIGRPFGEEMVLALAKEMQQLCSIGLPDLDKIS